MKTTNTEVAAVAQTQTSALALITLSPEKYAAEVYAPFAASLDKAIDSVRAVDYDITTTAGMSAAIKCRALFRDMRVSADKERKARKEPITKIGKLLESGFDQIEERITPLEEMFDADIKAEEDRKVAEKQAKIAAERARMAAIADALDAIRECETDMVRFTKTATEAKDAMTALSGLEVTEATYQERFDEAVALKHATLEAMLAVHDARLAAEQAEAERLAAVAAETERLAAERVELARLREVAAVEARIVAAQQAEAKRLADIELAAQRAELERRAAENLAAENKARAEQVERERLAAAAAKAIADEQAATAAHLKAQQDAFNAQIAAAAQAEQDRIDAAAKAAADEVERQRLQEMVETAQSAPRHEVESLEELACAVADDDIGPTDAEIVDVIAETFGMSAGQVIARLKGMDFVALEAL